MKNLPYTTLTLSKSPVTLPYTLFICKWKGGLEEFLVFSDSIRLISNMLMKNVPEALTIVGSPNADAANPVYAV